MRESELRQDPVSGDWIIFSPGRAKRPHDFMEKLPKRKRSPVKGCPFENPDGSGHKAILTYPNHRQWAVKVVENKYPVVTHQEKCGVFTKKGPHGLVPGAGHHDLVISRDHDKNFAHLSAQNANLVFQAFRDRYLTLVDHPCIAYISILHNWGPTAGASIYHPHYQMLSIPVVPPDVSHSLAGSARYYKEHKKCVHCVMIDWDIKEKKRIVFQNDGALAVAPFVSRSPFEIRVFPKKHLSYFENTHDEDIAAVVEATQFALKKLEKNVGDPDYNFFIHTAPIQDKEKYGHYHWHLEILPRLSIRASFELGTGLDINSVDPQDAARILRK